MAALLALGPGAMPVAAQFDLAAIRARAEAGDADALNTLGNLAANGQGVPQSDTEALRLYRLAADRGHAPANFNLGMMHELGRGTLRDLEAAFGFYLKAAEAGFAPAQFNVGNMYANGVGTPQDYFEAAIWFRQAAERNVPEAQYNLGLAYELGRGLTKDETLAVKWYRSASEQGYARARYNLALMLEEGRGAAVDEVSAAQLYRIAAEQGFGPAQNNYGIMLAEGRGGLVPNLIEAYAWLALAADNGVNPVGRDLVAGRLAPDQLAAARNRYTIVRSQLAGQVAAPTLAAAAPSAPAPAPTRPSAPAVDTGAAQAAALTARLQAAEADLERLRGENNRLASALQALQQERVALEQRLNQVAAAAQAVPAVQAQLESERNSLRATNSDLTGQLAQSREELRQATEKLARLEAEQARLAVRPAASDPAVAGLREQVERLTRETATLRDEKEALAAQNRDFAAQLQAARSTVAPAVATAPESTDETVIRLRGENQRLNDEVKRATIELSNLARRLRRAEERATGPAPAASDAPATDLSPQLAALQQQLDAAQAANRQLSDENARLAARPASDPAVAERLATAENEVQSLRREVQAQAANLEQARSALAATEQQLAAATAARGSAETQGGAENRRLAADLADVQARLDETMAQLVASRRETEEMRVEAQAVQGRSAVEVSRLQNQLADVTRQLEAIRGENAALQQRLSESASTKPATDGTEFTQAIADLAATRARLAEARQAADAAAQTVRNREAENTDLLTQIGTLQSQVAALQNRPAAPDQGRELTDLRAELAVAKDEAARAQRDRQGLATDVAETKDALRRTEQSSAQWQARTTELLAEVDRLTRENRQLAAAPAKAEPGKDVEQLTAQLDAAAQTLEAKDRRINELSGQVSSLQQDLEVAKQSTAAALAAQASAARAVPDATAMQLEMQTLQDRVKTLEAQNQQDQKNAAEEFARLAGQLQLARDANRALAEANRALLNSGDSQTVRTQESEQLNARVRELTATTDKLTQERNGLKTQVDDMFAKLADAERRLTQLKQEGDLARNQAQSAQADLAALQSKLAESDHATDKQSATVAELTGLNDRLARDKANLETQLAQLKQQADRSQADLTALRDRLAAAERIGEIQKADANDFAAANEQLQAQVKTLTAQVETLKADNTRLGAQDEAVASLRRDVAALTATNQQLTSEIATLRNDSARLGLAEQARQEAEARAASLGNVTTQLVAAQRDVAALRAENARLNDTMQAIERDRTGRIAALQQENAAISARLRQAQGTLDQIASAARLMNPGTGNTVAPVRPVGASPEPAATQAAPQARTHIVVDGDSLSRISLRYYGTPNRWQEIYDANRDTLAGANALRPGQPLRIP